MECISWAYQNRMYTKNKMSDLFLLSETCHFYETSAWAGESFSKFRAVLHRKIVVIGADADADADDAGAATATAVDSVFPSIIFPRVWMT